MKKMIGFTLIELMIVVAIIGILAAVILPLFTDKKVSNQPRSEVRVRSGSQVQNQTPTTPAEIFACVDGVLFINNNKSSKNCKNSVNGVEILQ